MQGLKYQRKSGSTAVGRPPSPVTPVPTVTSSLLSPVDAAAVSSFRLRAEMQLNAALQQKRQAATANQSINPYKALIDESSKQSQFSTKPQQLSGGGGGGSVSRPTVGGDNFQKNTTFLHGALAGLGSHLHNPTNATTNHRAPSTPPVTASTSSRKSTEPKRFPNVLTDPFLRKSSSSGGMVGTQRRSIAGAAGATLARTAKDLAAMSQPMSPMAVAQSAVAGGHRSSPFTATSTASASPQSRQAPAGPPTQPTATTESHFTSIGHRHQYGQPGVGGLTTRRRGVAHGRRAGCTVGSEGDPARYGGEREWGFVGIRGKAGWGGAGLDGVAAGQWLVRWHGAVGDWWGSDSGPGANGGGDRVEIGARVEVHREEWAGAGEKSHSGASGWLRSGDAECATGRNEGLSLDWSLDLLIHDREMNRSRSIDWLIDYNWNLHDWLFGLLLTHSPSIDWLNEWACFLYNNISCFSLCSFAATYRSVPRNGESRRDAAKIDGSSAAGHDRGHPRVYAQVHGDAG